MFIDIFEFFVGLLCAWGCLCVGCEYRDYRGGHLFVKAFYAHRWYMKLFTVWQSRKDIKERDMGKLTYIGFVGVVISAASAVFVLPYTVYAYFYIGYTTAKNVYILWLAFNYIWGIGALVLQGVDSLLNRFTKR